MKTQAALASESSELGQLVRRCNRCGYCQEVCPTYLITPSEYEVARGRIHLLRMGLQEPEFFARNTDMFPHLEACLVCGSCAAVCPSGVDVERIIKLARHQALPVGTVGAGKRRFFRAGLADKGRLYRMAGFMRLGKGLLTSPGLARSTSGLGGMMAAGGSMMQGMADSPLGARYGLPFRVHAPQGVKKRGTVAYFLGCAPDAFSPRIGAATLAVLAHHGWEVIVPAVSCCGAPHQVAGDLDFARQLARRNLEALATLEVEAVVSECPTCVTHLRGYGELLADEPRYVEMARSLKARLGEATTFLARAGDPPPLNHLGRTATYHDPCHLVRGLAVSAEPRRTLARLAHFKEMKKADRCCGGAGSYGVFHPTFSFRILDQKMESVRATGADLLVTVCPSCVAQLRLGVTRAGLGAETVHLSELMARGLGFEPASALSQLVTRS